MIKKLILDAQKIKFEGTIDFIELYKYMKLWLEDQGYANERNIEKQYIEKIKPEGQKQVEIAWKTTKKKSEFFTFHIDLTILTLRMSKVEVPQEGIKRKMHQATFEIRITSYIQSTDKWEELKGLQKLYQELFVRKRLDVYWEELYNKSTAFFSYIKQFIGLRD